MWTNKIGPYTSPTESYGFFDHLPWCRPHEMERRPLKLGETLAGDLLVKSKYTINFMHPQSDAELCEKDLDADQVDMFLSAIRRRFVYDLLLDDLPMKLFVGETSGERDSMRYYLYTHIEFSLSVNGPHIIEISASSSLPVELKSGEPAKFRFSYSVKWEKVRPPSSFTVVAPQKNTPVRLRYVPSAHTPPVHPMRRPTSRTSAAPRSTATRSTRTIAKSTGSASETPFSASSS